MDKSPVSDLEQIIEFLKLELANRDAEITRQNALIAVLQEEIEKLKAQTAANSSNSSMPPSSDGYKKPTRQQIRNSERKAGKQNGDSGSHLSQVDNPDEVIILKPEVCESCNGDLSGSEIENIERRQVFDIPPIKVHVTEHQAQSVCCKRCGATTKASMPQRSMETEFQH